MNYTEKRPLVSYSNNLKNVFSLLTFSPNYNIAGTANLKSILYPSDYDLNETFVDKSNHKLALQHIVRMFQKKFKVIKNDVNVYFVDFKCGIDAEMYFDEITDVAKYRQYLKYLNSHHFISNDEFQDMNKLTNAEDIKDACRSLYVLRWSVDEILKGYKALSKNRQKTLGDAIMDASVIKLDVIARIGYANFIEISNIFHFVIKGKIEDEPTKTFIQILIDEAKEYHKYHDDYKALKRIFSIAKFQTNNKTMGLLVDVFNSNLGIINKARGDLEVLIDVMHNSKHTETDEINFAIQKIKQMLGNIYQFPFSDKIYHEFDNICKLHNGTDKTNKIEALIDTLKQITQKEAVIWINKNKLKSKLFAYL